jgi:hypothetical protein
VNESTPQLLTETCDESESSAIEDLSKLPPLHAGTQRHRSVAPMPDALREQAESNPARLTPIATLSSAGNKRRFEIYFG